MTTSWPGSATAVPRSTRMHKLRQVYPNLLALERTGLVATQAAGTQRPRPDRQHNELAMFP
ncbi:MAG: hypothetical protein R3E95_10970 [Thiolinea sp.]